jgi:hypothetical protein
MFGKSMVKKAVVCLMLAGWAATADAQYIPAYQPDSFAVKAADVVYWHKGNLLKHLEASLTVGTTGIGIDLAVPLSQYVQVRAGFDYMPPISMKYRHKVLGGGKEPTAYDEKGGRKETAFDEISNYWYDKTGYELEDHVDLKAKLTMYNAKLLVDVYPFKFNKKWHFTAGLYLGPSQFAEANQASGSEKMLNAILEYNKVYRAGSDVELEDLGLLSIQMGTYSHNFQKGDKKYLMNAAYEMEPTSDGKVNISCTSNSIKPYLGFGYGGLLFPSRNDWKITVEAGALIWGGTPSQTTHDGTDLSKDVQAYPHTITKIVKALKVYPVLSVRIAKTLF